MYLKSQNLKKIQFLRMLIFSNILFLAGWRIMKDEDW